MRCSARSAPAAFAGESASFIGQILFKSRNKIARKRAVVDREFRANLRDESPPCDWCQTAGAILRRARAASAIDRTRHGWRGWPWRF